MSKIMRKITSIVLTLTMVVTVCPQSELFEIGRAHV